MNPLAEYVVKIARSIESFKMRVGDREQEGARWAMKNMLEDLITLLPALENLVTWADGSPTEDGEYLVELDGEIFFGKVFYDEYQGRIFTNDTSFIKAEEIRRHAKLKVG